MGDDGGGECMLNIFTSANSKEKKRKANLGGQSSKSDDDPSLSDPPSKKFKAGNNSKDFQKNKETNLGGNPINNDDQTGGEKKKGNLKKSKGNGEKKKGNDKNKTERGGAGHVLTKDRPFISNLFTNNPEAPAVKMDADATNNNKKEEVFSSSDVEANPFQFHIRINSILKGQFGVEHFTQVQLAAIPVIAKGRKWPHWMFRNCFRLRHF